MFGRPYIYIYIYVYVIYYTSRSDSLLFNGYTLKILWGYISSYCRVWHSWGGSVLSLRKLHDQSSLGQVYRPTGSSAIIEGS